MTLILKMLFSGTKVKRNFKLLYFIMFIIYLDKVIFITIGNNELFAAENLFDSMANEIELVNDGKSHAKIIIPLDASRKIQNAANVLSLYIKKATGVSLDIIHDKYSDQSYGPVIYVGATTIDNMPFVQDGDDKFVIKSNSEEQTIVIYGASDWGTEFGVYDFLEQYVGVRWLMPGQNGTDVPRLNRIAVPNEIRVGQPHYTSRLFSGLMGSEQLIWARFNRMRSMITFHHNLFRLFPPEKYSITNPHFYPMNTMGNRYLPRDNGNYNWQPCFSADDIVDEAAKNIIDYFNRYPEKKTYSLGINDSHLFCRCSRCLGKLPKKKNFLGLEDYSDLYYDWANKVIGKVLKFHPDVYFGCLAYNEVAAPPKKAKVHPRLMPFMTYDRMKWIDKKIEQDGHGITQCWREKTSNLGWYDYAYGTPYCLPRVYFHHTAGYLKYGYQNGVRAYYAELYPNWGEGPKPYLILKLLWDPDLNVDETLDDWYLHAVGGEAAPYLKEYYKIWEHFWTIDIQKSSWFSKKGQYLSFFSPTYLKDVKLQMIMQSRKLLEECIAKAKTEKQRNRAKLIEKAFQYYEASALAYLGDQELLNISPQKDMCTTIYKVRDTICMAEKRRNLALKKFPKDPLVAHPVPISRYSETLGGQAWGQAGMKIVCDWIYRKGNKIDTITQSFLENPSCRSLQEVIKSSSYCEDISGEFQGKNF